MLKGVAGLPSFRKTSQYQEDRNIDDNSSFVIQSIRQAKQTLNISRFPKIKAKKMVIIDLYNLQ